MSELKRRIQAERPELPRGFESRHDALLHTLTHKEEIVMKKKVSISLAFVVVLLVLAFGMALAAGLGVFGQFAGQSGDSRLQSLEEVSQSYTDQSAIEELNAHFPALNFAASQAHYDGKSLYIAYTLSGPMTTLEYLDPKGAKEVQWEITPEDGMSTAWDEALDPKAYAEMQRRLSEDGRVLAVVYNQFVGDGAELSDGTYINPSRSDYKLLEDGGMQGYTEFEFPLPEAAQDKEKLEVVFKLLRTVYLYYQDETGEYYLLNYGERIDPIHLPVTVLKNGGQRQLQGEGSFERYSAAIAATMTDVDLKAECRITGPKSWATAWETWESGGEDYLFEYALYADGERIRTIGFSCLVEDGVITFLQEYEHPGNARELILRPVYSQSGERPQEDIALQ